MTNSGDDPVATIVVSGAGSGLGRALALGLARRGDRLALCGRTSDRLAETAVMAVEAGAPDVIWQAVDIADGAAVRSFAMDVVDRVGIVDGLVNNAGTLGVVGPLSGVDLEEWAASVRTNVVGTAAMTAAFGPAMRGSNLGSIVSLSGAGIGGPSGPERVSSYVASKAAIVALTETWARELAPIRVNAVAPGAVDTAFNESVLEAGAEVAGAELFESVRAQAAAPVPMQPFLDLALWLLSSQSDWVTGRLLSARWETPDVLEATRSDVESSDRYRLRRIDGVLFAPVEEDHT